VSADPLPPGLKAELVKAVRAALDAGRAANQTALRADRFQAAAAAADRLAADLRAAAELAGLAADLATFRESCRFLAELAQKAGKPDPP
jgi:hypothetical protein